MFVQDFRKEHSYDFVDLNGYVIVGACPTT
jgi:hypothetical protein